MAATAFRQQLTAFFKYELEESTKENILSGNISPILNTTRNYIDELIAIPVNCYVDYITVCCKREPIMASDVFQFSDIEDATINVCEAVCKHNVGCSMQEIGSLLLDDGIQRSPTALNKYGENHIKTAEAFGLAFRANRRQFFLTATGIIFCSLSQDKREKLLIRLILRNKLMVQLILAATNGVFELDAFLYDLSKSTYLRRRTNIKRIIALLQTSTEFDFSFLSSNIIL